MKYLLDTHTLLWYTLNESPLSSTAHELIINQNNEILISPVSYWEIAIKISIGKLILHQPYIISVDTALDQYGIQRLW